MSIESSGSFPCRLSRDVTSSVPIAGASPCLLFVPCEHVAWLRASRGARLEKACSGPLCWPKTSWWRLGERPNAQPDDCAKQRAVALQAANGTYSLRLG